VSVRAAAAVVVVVRVCVYWSCARAGVVVDYVHVLCVSFTYCSTDACRVSTMLRSV
jgi:hypothetical protein